MKAYLISPRLVSLQAALLLLAPVQGQPATGGDQIMDLQILEDFYIIQKTDAAKPLAELNAKYRTALQKARDDFQAAGNLDGVLEAERELQQIDKELIPDGKSANVTIAKFETVYLKQRADVAKSAEGPLRKADHDYLTGLENLAVRLTKAGKIDDAVKTRSRMEAAKKAIGRSTSVLIKPVTGLGADSIVKVVSATYGGGNIHADVTEKVRHFIEIKREDFGVSPSYLGVDPTPGWNKELRIRFTRNGVVHNFSGGENQPVRVEQIYGPQDKAELDQWLSGSRWKAEKELILNGDHTFTFTGRSGQHRWSIPDHKKILLEWADGESVECSFDDLWKSFKESSGAGRIYLKQK